MKEDLNDNREKLDTLYREILNARCNSALELAPEDEAVKSKDKEMEM